MAFPKGMVVLDKLPEFKGNVENAIDYALSYFAAQIERVSKMRVPHDKGTLQSSGFHKKIAPGKYRIMYGGRAEPYAGYQEFGQRKNKSHKVKNYTESGTGKRYLRGSAEAVNKNLPAEIKSILGSVKA